MSNHQPRHCLLNRLFERRSKKTSKLRVTGLCAGNSPGTGEFPAQMASNAENVSIWWCHHAYLDISLNQFEMSPNYYIYLKNYRYFSLSRDISNHLDISRIQMEIFLNQLQKFLFGWRYPYMKKLLLWKLYLDISLIYLAFPNTFSDISNTYIDIFNSIRDISNSVRDIYLIELIYFDIPITFRDISNIFRYICASMRYMRACVSSFLSYWGGDTNVLYG